MRYTLQISTLSRYIFKNHSPCSFRTLLPTAIVSTSNELVQERANNNIRVICPRTTSLVTWSMKRLQSNGEDDNLHQALPSTPGLPRHPYGNPMADFRLLHADQLPLRIHPLKTPLSFSFMVFLLLVLSRTISASPQL